jgi:CubicO group peptidase (beta-lactamase class C family)
VPSRPAAERIAVAKRWVPVAVVAGTVVAVTFAAPTPRGSEARATMVANPRTTAAQPRPAPAERAPEPPTPDIAGVSALLNDAIAARKLPGAVVVVGHGGRVVFRKAYGSRKLAGEPGLDGAPAPAEPMTEDTVFDMASLTKSIATATAVMQLYERGKVKFDDPIQTYLPEFNAANDPQRARITLRMLLTHTSGETGDVNLDDAWGLGGADHREGVRRALTTPLESSPGQGFRYSDINYILLGALIEKITGQSEATYVQRNVFTPLGMTDSRYLPAAQACGPHTMRGAAIVWAPGPGRADCAEGTWDTALLSRIAPTRHDGESARDPGRNPDFGHLLRGTVDDPTSRRMGGVAGHAGVFSTARDVSVFSQALLDRLAGRPSAFPLSQASLQLMTSPQQPGHTGEQVEAAAHADRQAVALSPNARDRLLAPRYPAIRGQNLRGFGWDIDTGYSTPRGAVFPVGSFGHTGFTGTALWIDPASDTYVILLSNAVHSPGSPPTLNLAGQVATVAARELGIDNAGPRRP